MKKSRFSEEQIASTLRHVDAGGPVPQVTRTLGIREERPMMSGTHATGRWPWQRSGGCGSWKRSTTP